eukprot:Em0008g178a
MYAAALTPLIASLTDLTNWSQCWYADDSACAAKLPKLREWFEHLCKLGPAYGYYPEPQKTVVVVDEVDEAEANACFSDSGVKVVRGQCYLGGFIGDPEGTKHYVEAKPRTKLTNSTYFCHITACCKGKSFANNSSQFFANSNWSYARTLIKGYESA